MRREGVRSTPTSGGQDLARQLHAGASVPKRTNQLNAWSGQAIEGGRARLADQRRGPRLAEILRVTIALCVDSDDRAVGVTENVLVEAGRLAVAALDHDVDPARRAGEPAREPAPPAARTVGSL